MKLVRIIPFSISLALLLFGTTECRKKGKVDPAKAFIKYYGGTDVDQAADFKATPDGGFILVGSTESYGNGQQVYVVKVDAKGNLEWVKTFGGANDDRGNSVAVLSDGNYVITGTYNDTKRSSATSNSDLFALKLDQNGNVIWSKTHSWGANFNEEGLSVIENYDGGLMFAGTTDSADYKANTVDFFKKVELFGLITDAAGDIRMNGLNQIGPFNYGADSIDDKTVNVLQAYDGEWIISSSSEKKGQPNPNTVQLAKYRLDVLTLSAPTAAPTKLDYADDGLCYAGRINKTSDNNYILTGKYVSASGTDIFVMKLDQSLTKIQSSIIDVGNAESGQSDIDNGVEVVSAQDGGFILVGTTYSDIGAGQQDIVLIKLNSSLQKEWEKTFGGAGDDEAVSVIATSDGGYALAGTIDFGNNGDQSNRSYVMTLIKVNDKGEIDNLK